MLDSSCPIWCSLMPRRADPIQKRCLQCGKRFEAWRMDARLCSRKCRGRKMRGEKPVRASRAQ